MARRLGPPARVHACARRSDAVPRSGIVVSVRYFEALTEEIDRTVRVGRPSICR
ncbi:hypothetical protein [Nocardia sp. NPDC051750]|uniref:hypothetical protein n=1 Tax=Nocardia sp. NPDC051750 TaxID=3364325 RepID=UPI0037B93176